MRIGAEFITRPSSKNKNLTYIIRKLNECCTIYGGTCDGCPDLGICVDAYDGCCNARYKK